MASRGKLADIDLEELERLSALQATDQEVASWFGVTTRTIERKRKQPGFAEAMERGKAKGRLTIRRAQLRMLEQGNATMGIWLGKQYLGQTDEIRHEVSVSAHLSVIMPRAVDPASGSPVLETRRLGDRYEAVTKTTEEENG